MATVPRKVLPGLDGHLRGRSSQLCSSSPSPPRVRYTSKAHGDSHPYLRKRAWGVASSRRERNAVCLAQVTIHKRRQTHAPRQRACDRAGCQPGERDLDPVTALVISHCHDVESDVLTPPTESFDRHSAINARATWLLVREFGRRFHLNQGIAPPTVVTARPVDDLCVEVGGRKESDRFSAANRSKPCRNLQSS